MSAIGTVAARRMPTPADIGLIVLCLAAAFTLPYTGARTDAPVRICVYRGDVRVAAFAPGRDTVLAVDGPCGTTRVEIRHGRARICESCCPRGECVEKGWIARPGSWVLCLPNRVMVRMTGEAHNGGVDAVGE